MSYRILQKKYGNRDLLKSIDINIGEEISDFLYLKDYGYFFALPLNHCIAHSDFNGNINLNWAGNLNKKKLAEGCGSTSGLDFPSSMCYDKIGRKIYIVVQNGKRVVSAELKSGYINFIWGSSVSALIDVFFEDVNENVRFGNTNITIKDNGDIFWMNSEFDRCFSLCDGRFSIPFGCHKRGYSVSNNKNLCFFCTPSGMVSDGKKIYVSDTGNHCIRCIDNDISIIAGNSNISGHESGAFPFNLLMSPSKLKYKNGIIYCIDENNIIYLSIKDKQIGTVYTGNNIMGIDIDDNKNLLILEKI